MTIADLTVDDLNLLMLGLDSIHRADESSDSLADLLVCMLTRTSPREARAKREEDQKEFVQACKEKYAKAVVLKGKIMQLRQLLEEAK